MRCRLIRELPVGARQQVTARISTSLQPGLEPGVVPSRQWLGGSHRYRAMRQAAFCLQSQVAPRGLLRPVQAEEIFYWAGYRIRDLGNNSVATVFRIPYPVSR